MPSLRFNRSVAARLVLANGAMLAATILAVSSVFYFETVGVMGRDLDAKILAISNRLDSTYGGRPAADLARQINQDLDEGIGADTEILLLTSPTGERLAGNLSRWPDEAIPQERLVSRDVVRNGRLTSARLFVRRLPTGGLLYIGQDLSGQQAIRRLVVRALGAALAISSILAVFSAWLFRREIEARISEIRQTAGRIEAGDLMSRIEISGDDEFARLGVDVNRMLDRIEQLVDGVRHVSNALAHDMRTPLTRIRNRLDDALTREMTVAAVSDAANVAISDIDDLILVFDKLLQISEAESGMRTQSFETVDLNGIVRDMVELYDAAAETRGVELHAGSQARILAPGDHDLLASAVASLIDNAIKYSGAGARVELFAYATPEGPVIVVQDNGPGVPESELPRLAERFYRLDRARGRPGNGLGLTIVSAIAALHGGQLALANTSRGLRATIKLPCVKPSVMERIPAQRETAFDPA